MNVVKDRRWIEHYVKGQGCSVNQGNKARKAVSQSFWHGPQAGLGIWGGEGVSFLRGTQGGEDTAPTWRQEEEGPVPGPWSVFSEKQGQGQPAESVTIPRGMRHKLAGAERADRKDGRKCSEIRMGDARECFGVPGMEPGSKSPPGRWDGPHICCKAGSPFNPLPVLRSDGTSQEETRPAVTSMWTVNCHISTRSDAPPGLVTSRARTAFPR